MQVAPPQPAYTVIPLPGNVEVERTSYDMDKKELVTKTVSEPAGFLVKFYAGHSIRVKDKEGLARLRLDLDPGLIDPNTGERITEDAPKPVKKVDMSREVNLIANDVKTKRKDE